MDKKKGRSTNFSKEEELSLLQEIVKFKHVIECKTTNKMNNKDKEEAWQKILNNFNSKIIEKGSLAQIKSKYDNLKTKTRKEVAKEKAYLRGTGGGPAIIKELDPIVETTLDIINLKTVVGLPPLFDKDLEIEEMKTPYIESELEPSMPDSEIILIETIGMDNKSASLEPEVNIDCNKENIDNDNIQSTSSNLHTTCELVGKRKYENNDWSKYVPNNFKRETNKKLRPKVKNPTYTAKEIYYKTKADILKKTFEAEERERTQRNEREAQEYEKKMILLNLEIE